MPPSNAAKLPSKPTHRRTTKARRLVEYKAQLIPDLWALLPVYTLSEANRASHEHWRVRQQRARSQRTTTRSLMHHALGFWGEPWITRSPVTITLVRISPRPLDDDNLASSQKAVRDGIADALNGGEDRSPRIVWRYEQEKGAPNTYGVRVLIRPRPDGAAK
jgi:hypothetical protein